jgi:hypothetical protein
VTELAQLGSHSMSLTVPTRMGIGSSLWQLHHTWRDTPQGLVVGSSQVVGVVEPGWRPVWYARWQNALVRGMFARGRGAERMLEQWMHHCVEEVRMFVGLGGGERVGAQLSAFHFWGECFNGALTQPPASWCHQSPSIHHSSS